MENSVDNSKIRFQILSDLHLEFTGVPDILPPVDAKSDYIALLGTFVVNGNSNHQRRYRKPKES